MTTEEFDKRFDEEVKKFAFQTDTGEADVNKFAEWICWFSRQGQREEIKEAINKIIK